MKDWAAKLDDFLRLAGRPVLDHKGTVSHGAAMAKAAQEYGHFSAPRLNRATPIEKHFDAAVREVKSLDKERQLSPEEIAAQARKFRESLRKMKK